ncbi:MAG: hypothetical protein EOP84_18150, partial [Verrucomicrobiaceae bacterium]
MHIGRLFVVLFSLVVCINSHANAATIVPFGFRDGLVWLKVSVPGRSEQLNFLLDSGAGSSVLDIAAARRLGVELGAAARVQGVNGGVAARQIDRFTAFVAGIQVPRRL